MRRAAVMALALLGMTGCATRGRPAVEAEQQAARARRQPLPFNPLGTPRAQADPEVRRLTALRDELLARLRATEDELLVVVVKSAAYDEAAGAKLAPLQQRRLLLTVALRELEEAREARAEELAAGTAAPKQVPAKTKQELDGRKADAGKNADSLQALLDDAAARLARARPQRRQRWKRALSSRRYAQSMDLAAAGKEQDDAAPPPPRGAGVAVASPSPERKPAEDALAQDDGEAWARDEVPPGGGGVEAAAVVTDGAPPDLGPALRPYLPRMQACIPPELLRQGLSFTVRARLGTDGSVRGARLSGGHGLTPSAAACVVDVMRQVRVPEGAGGRIVSVPMRISKR